MRRPGVVAMMSMLLLCARAALCLDERACIVARRHDRRALLSSQSMR